MTKSVLARKHLYVKKSSIHGYGVFAAQDIQADELIEECYGLLLGSGLQGLIDYVFHGNDEKTGVLALGYGSIYNHSEQPNARFIYDAEQQIVSFHALKSIRVDEEVLIHYGKNWFGSRHITSKPLSWRYRLRQFKPLLGMVTRFGVILVALYGCLTLLPFLHY